MDVKEGYLEGDHQKRPAPDEQIENWRIIVIFFNFAQWKTPSSLNGEGEILSTPASEGVNGRLAI